MLCSDYTDSETMPHTGAVACGHAATARAAVDILEAGGNAFDAAIAAQFAACIAEPVLASLAGGGFLLTRPAAGEPRLYDFFAHTPRARLGRSDAMLAVQADFGPATQTFHIGAASIATPGSVAGMFAIHQALGTLPMTELVDPAVRLAREGLMIDPFQGYVFDVVRPIYSSDAHYRRAFTGRHFRQPELADSMEALAREGADLFYRGAIGRALIDHCQAAGGHLSLEDLAAYRTIQRAPLSFQHAGATILTNPPPSAGGTLIRHSLETFRPEPELSHDRSGGALARAFEATERWRIGQRSNTDQVSRGTTHISVIDQAGNLAAMTLSNGEGCGSLIPGTGIMPNNMLGEEDINPDGIDRWRPDHRLGSMMAPTLILDGASTWALGSGGSNRIRTAIVQVIVNLLDHRLSDRAAVDAPRLHLEQGLLSLEPGFTAEDLVDIEVFAAEGRGHELHQWTEQNLFFGGVHLASHHDGGAGHTFHATGDPRRGGAGHLCRA